MEHALFETCLTMFLGLQQLHKVELSSTFCNDCISFTKLMVSHDLLRLTASNQIAFDQGDSKSISNFERAMDRCCQALVSRFFLGFPNWKPWIPSILTNWYGIL